MNSHKQHLLWKCRLMAVASNTEVLRVLGPHTELREPGNPIAPDCTWVHRGKVFLSITQEKKKKVTLFSCCPPSQWIFFSKTPLTKLFYINIYIYTERERQTNGQRQRDKNKRDRDTETETDTDRIMVEHAPDWKNCVLGISYHWFMHKGLIKSLLS